MHTPSRLSLVSLGSECLAAAAIQCSRPSATVLECSASDIRHVLRIHADEHRVDDLSFVPAKAGDVELTATEYLIHFYEPRDHYELLLRINRATGRGTRELFDDEQQLIRGHGGSDPIVCAPIDAPP